jgi:hypothetical protein
MIRQIAAVPIAVKAKMMKGMKTSWCIVVSLSNGPPLKTSAPFGDAPTSPDFLGETI